MQVKTLKIILQMALAEIIHVRFQI